MANTTSAATITDVARTAQVSVGTVSRVINGNPSVSADYLQRVMRAIEDLNYSPRQRKAAKPEVNPLENKTILLLMLGLGRSLAALPTLTGAFHGVERAVGKAGGNLLIADVPAADSVPEVLQRRRVDGVILKGAMQGNLAEATTEELWNQLRALPIVWMLGRPANCVGDVVQVNDMLVGKMAAEHLVAHGHRRLAFISAKPSQVVLLRRQASFTFYAQQLGATVKSYLGPEKNWAFPSPAVDHVELVQDLVSQALGERQPPTAIFAPDDSVGAMVARTLAAQGMQAGREISLMGCNNDRSLLMGIYPSLTTIDVHAEEIGHRAVDQLAWRMRHREETYLDVSVEPTLVEGGSVATIAP